MGLGASLVNESLHGAGGIFSPFSFATAAERFIFSSRRAPSEALGRT